MKNIIASLIFLIISFSSLASSGLIAEADSAYMGNDFDKALELYLKAAEKEGTSSVLFYNIGNTYYRLEQLGNAVLYYKKALKLNPKNSDARQNLEFIKTKLIDEQIESKTLSENINDKMISVFTPNGWAVAAIGCFVILLLATAIYILSPSISLRKTGFFGSIIFFVFTIIGVIFAVKSAKRVVNQNEGVVIVPVTTLSTVPRMPHDKAEEAFSLHEGAIVEILDSISTPTDSINNLWYEVKADETHRAWIPSIEISKI